MFKKNCTCFKEYKALFAFVWSGHNENISKAMAFVPKVVLWKSSFLFLKSTIKPKRGHEIDKKKPSNTFFELRQVVT